MAGRTGIRTSTILLVIVLVMVAGGALTSAPERWARSMKRNVLASGKQPEKPLIDMQQPKQTTLATFALG
jgi:hypothetical protein